MLFFIVLLFVEKSNWFADTIFPFLLACLIFRDQKQLLNDSNVIQHIFICVFTNTCCLADKPLSCSIKVCHLEAIRAASNDFSIAFLAALLCVLSSGVPSSWPALLPGIADCCCPVSALPVVALSVIIYFINFKKNVIKIIYLFM